MYAMEFANKKSQLSMTPLEMCVKFANISKFRYYDFNSCEKLIYLGHHDTPNKH